MLTEHIPGMGYCEDLTDNCDYVDIAEKPIPTNKQLSILQLNIRGVLGKQSLLTNLLKDTNKHSKAQIILLQETWLKKGTEKRLKIPSYIFPGSHRKNKKGGGVGILVPNRLLHRERKDLTLDIPGFKNITLEIKTHNRSIIVSSLYRPPKNYKRWLKKFSMDEGRRLIIGMDHNLDLIKSDKHQPTKEFIEVNLENELIPTITKTTRITRNTATLIDNIIIGRNYQSVYTSMILLTDISDHCPTMLELPNIDIYKTGPKRIQTRKLNLINIEKINDKLQETNWENLLDNLDTEESYNVYQTTLNGILNEITSVQEYTINPNKILRE